MKKRSIKQKIRNIVAKFARNKGGFHSSKKYSRKAKHKYKTDE